MALDTVGILASVDFTAEQRTVISAVPREIFVDETPLYSRLAHMPATGTSWTINRRDVRQRTYAVATGGITNSATTLPIADASMFQVGDVLQLTTAADSTVYERVEVITAPSITPTPNTLTIRRAREGTTGTAFSAADVIKLIGNSRTGAEIDQQGFRGVSTALQQYLQTFQYPVQVGRLANAISNVVLPPGANSVMGYDRAVKLVEATRDVEYSMYYGIGEQPAASGDRGKMKGLKTLIASYNSGANVSTSAKTNYTRGSFLTDTILKIQKAGGSADTILCSTDFLSFLDTWVPGKQAVMGTGRTNELGFPITTFVLPLGGKPLNFVEAIQLEPGTACVLTSSDLDIRTVDEMHWQPRERRGDAIEGDWVGDYAINLGHPYWHAWVEGIGSAA